MCVCVQGAGEDAVKQVTVFVGFVSLGWCVYLCICVCVCVCECERCSVK